MLLEDSDCKARWYTDSLSLCVFSSNTDCKKIVFYFLWFISHHARPSAICLEVLPARPRRACVKFWPTFLKIARGWRHLAKRVSVAWRRGREFFWGRDWGGGHSCQPLLTANRYPRIHRDSHGSAAPSQWRRAIGESGRVRRREENNRWCSRRLLFVGRRDAALVDGLLRANQSDPWDSAVER